MNPIRKKIKHLIPSYQFGGDTNFFDYFKSIVPKIKSYQGQTNGESNLYGSNSQDYYRGLIGRNSDVSAEYQRTSNNYLGEWGDDAHNFYYRQDWDKRNPNATEADKDRFDQYALFEKTANNLTGPDYTEGLLKAGINPGDYNSWYKARDREANRFGAEWEKNQKDHLAVTEQKNNQILETGANIFSLMKGQETYDNKPKESFDTTNTGSSGYRFQFGGNNNNSSYDQILKNIQLDNVIKNLPITRKVSATNPSKKLYDNAGDQLISDINYVFKDKKARAKADPILKYIAESGVSKKLEKLDNKDISYIKDTVNKTGFFSLGNIGKYKDLYKYIKTETGLTSEDAKGILNKAVENESWLKRNSIKAAINPFLQFGGNSAF